MKKLNKLDKVMFIIIVLFSFCIFSGYLVGHFAADTFNIINIGYEKYAINYSLTDGRVFMAFIGFLANMLHMPIVIYIIVLQILAIVVSCYCVIVLKNIILKYKNIENITEHIFLLVVCYYTIFNFSYFENMYFVECFVMSLSILFYILAADKIIKNSEVDNIKAVILVFLGLISYQGTISAFFIFVVLFSMLNNEKLKAFIKSFIRSILIFLLGFFYNNGCIIITENIFHTTQTRGINLGEIFLNIKFIIERITIVLKNTANLFPKNLYITFIIIVSILVCIKIIMKMSKKSENENYRKNLIILFEQFTIIILSIAFAFIPSVINLTGFWSARMRFSIGAIIGILFIHLIVKTDILKRKGILNKLLIIIFVIYGIINSINYVYLIKLNKQQNKLDEQYTYSIDNYISDYEEKNKIKVTNISIILIEDNVDKAYYEEMNCEGVGTAVSSVRTEWASQGIINYYTNRNLKSKEVTDQEIQDYLNKVDKNKGYLCINDTLYISVYMY